MQSNKQKCKDSDTVFGPRERLTIYLKSYQHIVYKYEFTAKMPF